MVAVNGFPVTPDISALGVRRFLVPGTNVVLPVRADIAPLLIGFARDFHQEVEPLRKDWCWGYAFRSVRGGQTPSFHAAGIAVDLNAPAHPLGQRGTFPAAKANIIRGLASRYGLRWGGDYKRRADEMHLEVILPRDRALALVARLQRSPGQRYEPYRTGIAPGARTLRRGAAGDDVAYMQRRLRLKGDGYSGPATEAAVRSYQKGLGLTPDGVVGPNTWKRLGVR